MTSFFEKTCIISIFLYKQVVNSPQTHPIKQTYRLKKNISSPFPVIQTRAIKQLTSLISSDCATRSLRSGRRAKGWFAQRRRGSERGTETPEFDSRVSFAPEKSSRSISSLAKRPGDRACTPLYSALCSCGNRPGFCRFREWGRFLVGLIVLDEKRPN